MAYSFYLKDSSSISYKEFIEAITSKIKFGDENSLLDCVDDLLMLCNNKSFFADYLNQELSKNLELFQNKNTYGEQSYMLYDHDNYYVRVTYWPLISQQPLIKEAQMKSFSYDFPHDHNFCLLTAGYKGEGYRTKLWEYDYTKVIGYKGEHVKLNFLEETFLSEGKALYYRPSKDIHSQFAPQHEDSLAVNIILKDLKYRLNRQFTFDVENNLIKGYLSDSYSSLLGLFDLAVKYHDSKTIDVLLKIFEVNAFPVIKREAINTLYSITNDSQFLIKGVNDKDSSNSKFFKKRIEELS